MAKTKTAEGFGKGLAPLSLEEPHAAYAMTDGRLLCERLVYSLDLHGDRPKVIRTHEAVMTEVQRIPRERGEGTESPAYSKEILNAFLDSGMAACEVEALAIDDKRLFDALRQTLHRNTRAYPGIRALSRSKRIFLINERMAREEAGGTETGRKDDGA